MSIVDPGGTLTGGGVVVDVGGGVAGAPGTPGAATGPCSCTITGDSAIYRCTITTDQAVYRCTITGDSPAQ